MSPLSQIISTEPFLRMEKTQGLATVYAALSLGMYLQKERRDSALAGWGEASKGKAITNAAVSSFWSGWRFMIGKDATLNFCDALQLPLQALRQFR